jgi:hypothetical protein
MASIHVRPKHGALLVALAALGLAAAVGPAGAAHHRDAAAAGHHNQQRLVVRGDATAVDGPCDAQACLVELADGSFRGTPVGTGAYSGSVKLKIAAAFPNGEDGSCAPLEARLVLGAGTPDRLVLAVAGDSCQDGAGPLETSSFTGLARFTVVRGTGDYARATGGGRASFTEDAANRHRMTLVGRIGG